MHTMDEKGPGGWVPEPLGSNLYLWGISPSPHQGEGCSYWKGVGDEGSGSQDEVEMQFPGSAWEVPEGHDYG